MYQNPYLHVEVTKWDRIIAASYNDSSSTLFTCPKCFCLVVDKSAVIILITVKRSQNEVPT